MKVFVPKALHSWIRQLILQTTIFTIEVRKRIDVDDTETVLTGQYGSESLRPLLPANGPLHCNQLITS